MVEVWVINNVAPRAKNDKPSSFAARLFSYSVDQSEPLSLHFRNWIRAQLLAFAGSLGVSL